MAGRTLINDVNEEEVVENRDRFFQLDNPYIGLPIIFLVVTFVIIMLIPIVLGKSIEYAFLLWIEMVILLGGWKSFLYLSIFVLSDRLTENQLGLLMWTVGIGVLIGWVGVVMCVIAPSLGLPVQCKG